MRGHPMHHRPLDQRRPEHMAPALPRPSGLTRCGRFRAPHRCADMGRTAPMALGCNLLPPGTPPREQSTSCGSRRCDLACPGACRWRPPRLGCPLSSCCGPWRGVEGKSRAWHRQARSEETVARGSARTRGGDSSLPPVSGSLQTTARRCRHRLSDKGHCVCGAVHRQNLQPGLGALLDQGRPIGGGRVRKPWHT